MKKIIALLLLLTMFATIVLGCKDNGTGSNETADQADTTVLADTTLGEIKIPEYELSDEIMFVNHQTSGRSGHLGHALVEYEPNKILAFYSNTDGDIRSGHNCIGWVEYKRSEDGGQTWSESKRLKYSTDTMLNGEGYIACEKAVLASDGTIVLFCYRSVPNTEYYGPILTTMCLQEQTLCTGGSPLNIQSDVIRIFQRTKMIRRLL